MAALLGRDYVIPDDVKVLAEPALAHRLIIKTSSTIHDVQPGQVIRELLDTTAVEGVHPQGREASPRPLRPAAVGSAESAGMARESSV
jgi:MoxR-like ATPase